MIERKEVKPEYRFLKVGERVQVGDEYECNTGWKPYPSSFVEEMIKTGDDLVYKCDRQIRRKL